MHKRFIHKFLISFSDSGFLLVLAAILALIAANSPYRDLYYSLLAYSPDIGIFGKNLSVQLWINDLGMALFFLWVGLEIKREWVGGALNDWRSASLPVAAAIGGMVAPALIYMAITQPYPEFWRGWAVASATDIAFSLAVLSVVGRHIPVALKLFLTALAIIDDLGAIIIIAVFYTAQLHMLPLVAALACLAVLWALNRRGVTTLWPYLAVGMVLWVAVLCSGVHATLAGVMLAFFIPMGTNANAPLQKLEQALHPWVGYMILPLFGFANSGLSLGGMNWTSLLHPVTLGIGAGLFLGKPLGIFAASYLFLQGRSDALPKHCTWMHIYGASIIAGIGFTMSLFIGSLAFDSPDLWDAVKLGVLCGSILSAIYGYMILRSTPSHGKKLP